MKTIFEGRDPNMKLTRKCYIFFLNLGACFIQLASITLCLMFKITMTTEEKTNLHRYVIERDVTVVVSRPALTEGWFGEPLMYELPIALFLLSLSYWENYAEGDFEVLGKVISFKSWKKHLHHSRERLYMFASVWKVVWTIAFAVILQSGFNFNLTFTSPTVAQQTQTTMTPLTSPPPTTVAMTTLIDNQTSGLQKLVRRDLNHASSLDSVNIPTEMSLFQSQVLNESVPNSSDEQDPIRLPLTSNSNGDDGIINLSFETKRHFEQYGLLYLQIISSCVLTYFGSTACKMCMQMFGFSLPVTLATPLSIAIVVLQCTYEFLPTGVFVWIGVERGNGWLLHVSWLGILWLSEVFIVSHIWFPSNGRMENTDR